MKNKIIFGIIIILSFLGTFFLITCLHEALHVFESEGRATGVCLTLNTKVDDLTQEGPVMMITTFDIDKFEGLEQYENFRQLTEKHALILTFLLIPILFTGLGAGLYKLKMEY